MHNTQYFESIRNRLIPVINRGNQDLTMLSKHADGAFPTDIIRALQNEINTDYIKFNKFFINKNTIFPESNPIDFEWRFTRKSVQDILTMIDGVNLNIGCLGTPTVFQELTKNKEHNTILFDINPFFKSYLPIPRSEKICKFDFEEKPLLGYQFDIIIMDPPWYENKYKLWLKQGINNLKDDGVIFITRIPKLLRPSAEQEWKRIIKSFKGVLNFIETNIKVEYVTPIFEIETLHSLGIYMTDNWRNTQVIKCRLQKKNIFPLKTGKKDKWVRYIFDNQIVSILSDSTDTSTIKVVSPYKDGSYILKSVSKRDSIRNKINFITSRNRVLKVTGMNKMSTFLENLSKNSAFQDAIKSMKLTMNEIKNLKIVYSIIGVKNGKNNFSKI